ncbi:MAG: hypothetical protein HZB61_14835 [Nitrospirae bacterium]|nr:hypothetical protein [Nitrospirota bacterium]
MLIPYLKRDGSEVVTFCHGLKLTAPDGKSRETDCANTEGIFRIIQSIPSPKAEPFKRWLAKVGYERVQEIENPTPQSPLDRGEVNADTSALEKQIDEMVYALYALTPEEIAIVEGKK